MGESSEFACAEVIASFPKRRIRLRYSIREVPPARVSAEPNTKFDRRYAAWLAKNR